MFLKKTLSLVLALLLVLSAAAALADPVQIDPYENRSIQINKAGDNEVPDGVSPTTGLTLSEIELPDDANFVGQAVTGRYTPVLVQIDNTDGGFGNRAPWNGSYADIVYETPLYKRGVTRISMLFSDVIPDYVAPVRSTRVNHVWLREEWDAAFVFWGGQQYEKTNIYTAIEQLGHKVNVDNIFYDGTNGAGASHPWKAYMDHTDRMARPHNAYAMLSMLMTQVYPQNYTPATNHAYKFADELPTGGDEATNIYVTWGDETYHSMLEYDEDDNLYYRYMTVDAKNPQLYDDISPVITKSDKIVHNRPISFSNVIVQWMKIEYPTTDGPKPVLIDTDNADYFIGGRHFKGVWNRDSYTDRTVFYGEDGNEIELQRGHTLIIMMDYVDVTDGQKNEPVNKNRTVSYE